MVFMNGNDLYCDSLIRALTTAGYYLALICVMHPPLTDRDCRRDASSTTSRICGFRACSHVFTGYRFSTTIKQATFIMCQKADIFTHITHLIVMSIYSRWPTLRLVWVIKIGIH